MKTNVLSLDFGASSVRAILGKFDGKRLEIEEKHRFENKPVELEGTLYWDMNLLWTELKDILKSVCKNEEISSLAIDTWGVDFGLIDRKGNLIESPVHYRDKRTDGMVREVEKHIPLEELYRQTGNQIIFFNTIFQLMYLNTYKKELLSQADSLLLMPDLFNYLLTGEKRAEETIASTSQLFDPVQKEWNKEVIKRLSLRENLFQEMVSPGEEIGLLTEELAVELQIKQIPVVATTSHDTASAFVSVPAAMEDFLFVSCGTWSLIGTELDKPIINEKSAEYNITNESGFNDTTRFLKNVTGLWILQEVKREFEKENNVYSYKQIAELAEQATPFQYILDVDAGAFQQPGNMVDKIKNYLRNTNQEIPKSDWEIFRLIYESMALKYREVFEEIKDCVGKTYEDVYIVGGGSQANILCQMIADSSNIKVFAGPVEATVIGNSLVQLISQNVIKGIQEARKIVKNSFNLKEFHPNGNAWDEHYRQYKTIIERERNKSNA